MGFALELVEGGGGAGPAGSMVQEFVCAVCGDLAQVPVQTACSHVFCGGCLEAWREAQVREGRGPAQVPCPKCNAPLGSEGARALRECNPLAARLLGRVRCRCPLHAQGCTWRGDYDQLQSHLTAADAHTNLPEPGAPGRPCAAAPGASAPGVSAAADFVPGAEASGAAVPGAAPTGGGGADAADTFKEEGNRHFRAGQYREALRLYSRAVALSPGRAALYGNRAAAWLMLGATAECVADCEVAVGLDAAYSRGYSRMAKALMRQGELSRARRALEGGLRAAAGDASLKKEVQDFEGVLTPLQQAAEALRGGQADEALLLLSGMMQGDDCPPLASLLAARASLALGRCAPALRLGLGTLKKFSQAPSGGGATRTGEAQVAAERAREQLWGTGGLDLGRGAGDTSRTDILFQGFSICAGALYYEGEFEKALEHAREALRIDPDSPEGSRAYKKMRKVSRAYGEAQEASKERAFSEVEIKIGEALEADPQLGTAPLAALLFTERANARLRLKNFKGSIVDCDAALKVQPDCRGAFLHKSCALQAAGDLEGASAAIAELLTFHPGDSVAQERQVKLRFEVRKSKRPDYYGLLDASSVTSGPEIKVSYKRQCLLWHPDKHEEGEPREKAEARFKLIGEAYEVLSDERKRALYDEGHDLEAILERVQAAERAYREGPRRGHGGCGGGGCGPGGCG